MDLKQPLPNAGGFLGAGQHDEFQPQFVLEPCADFQKIVGITQGAGGAELQAVLRSGAELLEKLAQRVAELLQCGIGHASGREDRFAKAQGHVLAQDQFQRSGGMPHGRGQPNGVAANLQNREPHQNQSRQERMRAPTAAISPSP